jgi:hypothetical protein
MWNYMNALKSRFHIHVSLSQRNLNGLKAYEGRTKAPVPTCFRCRLRPSALVDVELLLVDSGVAFYDDGAFGEFFHLV